MAANNVVKFPNLIGNNQPVPQSEEQRLANVKAYQTRFVLDTSIELSYDLFDDVMSKGLDLTANPKIDQDMLMVCESIKAMMLRACGIDHPLHKVTEEIVNPGESKTYKAVWESLRETIENDPH